MSTDDVVVRLRLAEVSKFIADVKSGKRSIDDLEKSVRKVGDTSRRVSGPSHIGLLDATVGRLKYAAAGLTFVFGSAIVKIAEFGIKATASLEQVQTGFTTMLKSKAAAKDLVKDLQDFSDWSPFVDADVYRWGQTLVGFGAKAQQVVPILTALGDAVSSIGKGPEDVSGALTALTQIATRTVLSMDEINQLSQHGIYAAEILQKGLGLSPSAFNKAIEQRRISSSVAIPMLLKSLEDAYAGSMDAMSRTIVGRWSTLTSKMGRALTADPDSPFSIAVNKWLTGLINEMPAIQAFLARWFTRIWDLGGAVKAAADRAKAAVTSVMGKVAAAQGAGDWYHLGSEAGSGTADLGARIVDSMFTALGKFAWFDVGVKVGSNINGFLYGFVTGLMDPDTAITLFKKHWLGMILVVVGLIPGLGKGLGIIGKVLSKIPILRFFAPMFERAAPVVERWLSKPIRTLMQKIGHAVFRAFEQVFPRSGNFLRHWIIDTFRTQRGEFRKLGQDLAGIFHDGFFGGVQSLAGWFFRLTARIGRGVRLHVLRPVRLFFGVQLALIFAESWGKLKEMFGGVKSWFEDLFVGIVNWVIDMVNKLLSVDVGGHSIGGHIDHIGAPKAARGATVTGAGVLEVGDAGRELIRVPKGADVIPLQRAHTGDFGTLGDRVPAFNLYLDSRPLRYAIERRQDDAVART